MSRWFKKKCVSMPNFFHVGTSQVDGFLQDQEMCTAVVKSLCIYKAPLHTGTVPVLPTIYHHFLVVEVSAVVHPDGTHLNGLLIRAEKAENGEKTGITVKNVPFVQESDAEVHHKVDIANLCVRIPMRQLLAILTDHSPHYDLLAANCWKYADSTFRALLEAFRELQQVAGQHLNTTRHQQEARQHLSTHLDQMPTLVMPSTRIRQIGRLALAATRPGVATGVATTFLYQGLSSYFQRDEEEEEEEETLTADAA